MSHSIFGWGYPPGSEHDPDAPWNQKDSREEEDEDEEEEDPQERACEKADLARDREKDERP